MANTWSKSYPYKPKNNLQSHILINKKPFIASFEKEPTDPPSMSLIIAGEYARIWQKEHCEYKKKEKKTTKVKSTNHNLVDRFNKWLENYNAKKKKFIQKDTAALEQK